MKSLGLWEFISQFNRFDLPTWWNEKRVQRILWAERASVQILVDSDGGSHDLLFVIILDEVMKYLSFLLLIGWVFNQSDGVEDLHEKPVALNSRLQNYTGCGKARWSLDLFRPEIQKVVDICHKPSNLWLNTIRRNDICCLPYMVDIYWSDLLSMNRWCQ